MPPKGSARKKVAETRSSVQETASTKISRSLGTKASSSAVEGEIRDVMQNEEVQGTENVISSPKNSNKRQSTSISETRVIKMPRILKSPPTVGETRLSMSKKLAEEVSKEDVTSPRRSARAVVPNSRYKDMVDPTTKAVGKQMPGSKKRNGVQHMKGLGSVMYTASKIQGPDSHILETVNQKSPVCEILEEVVTEETNIDQDAQTQLMEQSENMVQFNPSESEQLQTDFVLKGTRSALVQPKKIIESIESGQFDGQGRTTRKGLQHTITVKQVASLESMKPIPSRSAATDSAEDFVMPSEENEDLLKVSKHAGKEIVYQQVNKKGTTIITISKDEKLVQKRVAPVLHSSLDKRAESKIFIGRCQEEFVPKPSIVSEKTLVVSPSQSPTVPIKQDTVVNAAVRRKTPAILSAKIITRGKPADCSVSNSNHRAIQVIRVENIKKDETLKKSVGLHKDQEAAIPNSDAVHFVNSSKSVTNPAASTGQITESEQTATTPSELACNETQLQESTEQAPPLPSESEPDQVQMLDSSVSKVGVEDGDAVIPESQTRLQPIQTDVSSLCEVVEFKGKLTSRMTPKPSKSVVEFVMLNDQIIRISKPAVNKFGRIDHSQKTGAGDGAVTCPGDIGTIIAGLDDVLTPVSKVQDPESSNPEGKDMNKAASFHGYVTHTGKSGSQELVEISHDAFTKEVYGDGYTLDPETGTVVAVDASSNIEADTVDTGTDIGASGKLQRDASNQGSHSAETIGISAGDLDPQMTEDCSVNERPSFQEPIIMDTDGFYVCLDCNFKSMEMDDWIQHRRKHQEGADTVVTSSRESTTVGSSVIRSEGMDDSDNVICIQGLDPSQLGDNARITVEKMASGGEAFILHIDPSGETTHVQAGMQAGESTGPGISTVHEVVKVMPVDLSEAADDFPTVKRGRQSLDPHCQEFVIVHLPEGSSIKQYQARPLLKMRNPVDDAVTMDADGFYMCVDCDHKTDKRSNWYKHRRKHLGIRPHACTRCSYRAATSSNLKRHMQIHDDIRNFECHLCGLHFRQKIHLERHLKYKHEEKKIVCPLCDYQCASANPDLKMHIRKRHMPLEGSMDAFTCDICGLMTVSKKDLKQHMKFHKKGPELKLFCEYCSFVTDCLSRLRRHLLVHTKERPFQCGLCQYRASQKEHVLRHMRSQHNVEVETRQKKTLLDIQTIMKDDNVIIPKNSDGGQATMSSKYKVFNIEKTDNVVKSDGVGHFEKSDFSSQEKIFACNHCSMKFARLINLYKHLYAQHESVMPNSSCSGHQCVVCDFVTNSKKNLLVHMRKHNMQDHSPPTHVYSCVLCRYMNPKRRNLFQHMKKKHGIEIVMKEDGLNCYVTMEAENFLHGTTSTANEMPLSEIVTTEPISRDTALQVISDYNASLGADRISLDNIISMEEIGSYVATQVDVHEQSSFAGIQTHEAAEAIEGLQALAEQPGILDTQGLDNELTTEVITTEILNDGEITLDTGSVTEGNHEGSCGGSAGFERSFGGGEDGGMVGGIVQHDHIQGLGMGQYVEGRNGNEGFQSIGQLARDVIRDEGQESSQGEGIELSAEELNQLSTGDYVEINGEVYKVEIASGN
ncbi:uncharacterized protein LOC127850196 isoform X2 [Dreissena polymorpha]|uniref:uncharacterized protein LOC127850196 isoform X2 n=1 Tax=Dreissena polymorpha TaxID=45954 RepID=UPI002265034B|nr:uncharacterized protein LOC127850196 isoform X2 [Dreissena polymorpha]